MTPEELEAIRARDTAAGPYGGTGIGGDRRALLAEVDRLQGLTLEGRKDALREARKVISQYLTTAEKWRYDRVLWAFAIMLGEIPEDTPEPLSPADEEEIRRRSAS